MSSPRIQQLNQHPVAAGKYVLLLMRCARSRCSPSFSFAAERANASAVPVLAAFVYQPERHNLAQRVFLLEGTIPLKQALASLGTPLLPVKAKANAEAAKFVSKLSEKACEVVLDAGYLRPDFEYDAKVLEKLNSQKRRLTKVEGNVVVPVQTISGKPEARAQGIRRKVQQHMDEMLKEKWDEKPKVKCENAKKLIGNEVPEMNVFEELKKAKQECKTHVNCLKGGEDEAHIVFEEFLQHKLKTYDKERNVPDARNQSNLSPYIHYGMISPMEIVHKIKEAKAPKSAKDAFLEELVIRRELSHNFVYYYKDTYDSFKCLPDWAKKTMSQHKKDEKKFIYTFEDLEDARTHDPYWNAAQLELVYQHKMHGYMRMYWAKKVIEWMPSYEDACKFCINQNDKYELDGRDPNGYCGVMWNFGMHDRPYQERPVFGKIRYMNANGLRRKFKEKIDDYVNVNYKRAGREFKDILEPPTKKARTRAAPKNTKPVDDMRPTEIEGHDQSY